MKCLIFFLPFLFIKSSVFDYLNMKTFQFKEAFMSDSPKFPDQVRELEEINIPELRGIFGRIQGTSTGA